MKRIVFLVVAILLMFSLFGCANNLEAQVNELVEQKMQELENEGDGDDEIADNTSSNETNDEEDMDNMDDMESEYNWDTLDGSTVPDGYPNDLVPIVGVDNGVILGSAKQTMGDEATSYVIIFGIDESIADVAAAIQEGLEQHIISAGGEFDVLTAQIMMGEVDNCQYTITIGDGSADGFQTTVDYTVIVTN